MASEVNSPDRLLRLREAADRVGVCVRTLYRIIADGQLPRPIKVRGCSRVPESAIAEYIERLKRRGSA